MTIYSLIDTHILLPVAARLQHSNILKEYKKLKSTEWLSDRKLRELQNSKLQALMRHCYANVPYYTKLFDRLGLKPEDIKCREDLVKLPMLTKQLIRDNYDDLISKDASRRRPHAESSGGSTGVPLRFMTDKCNWGIKWSSTFRSWDWAGFHLGERIFTFGGNSLVKTKKEKRLITPKDIFDRVIMRNLKCDCSDLSDKGLKQIYKKMIAYKPTALRGYPAAIYNLAKYMQENSLAAPKIKAIFTTGEMLLPMHRILIQKVFAAPLFDAYGAGDGGIVSHECYMHEGMHITEEQCVLEIADAEGNVKADGELGFVLSTDLDNYLFPFVRYQVGDMAVIKKEKCSCGRASRLIAKVEGRSGKTLYNKKGEAFTSIIIDNMMFKNMDFHRDEHNRIYQMMSQFQVRQDSHGDIEILIIPASDDVLLSTFDYVKENFARHFEGSKIEMRYVTEIPRMASGKEDYCVSDYQPQ